MPIVSSTHAVGHEQRDGRSYVVESHTDDIAVAHRVEYLAAAGADYVGIRAARAVALSIAMADAEAIDKVDAPMAVGLTFRHQTAGEFADRFWRRLRLAFKQGDKFTYHFMVWWIWQRQQQGDLTSNQVRLSFNSAYGRSLTVAEWNVLVAARFIPIKDRYLAWLAEGDL